MDVTGVLGAGISTPKDRNFFCMEDEPEYIRQALVGSGKRGLLKTTY